MSLPSTLHAMFADSYIDKVNQPIKALCEILKITASKLIAAAVETLWQTIVRLANEIDFVNIAVSKHRVQR